MYAVCMYVNLKVIFRREGLNQNAFSIKSFISPFVSIISQYGSCLSVNEFENGFVCLVGLWFALECESIEIISDGFFFTLASENEQNLYIRPTFDRLITRKYDQGKTEG